MRSILQQNNHDLLREIYILKSSLSNLKTPEELNPYCKWISSRIDLLRDRVLKNLRYLDLTNDDILEEIMYWTQELTRSFQSLNKNFAGPIFRSLTTDRLCLKVIKWLHSKHPETENTPIGLSDGEFGIYPVLTFPIIYFMPSSAQRGLLYLPLFFHEFGHLLYACHREELDDLVHELQNSIEDLLRGTSHRNDSYAEEDLKQQKTIVETWYRWAQEIFCDAVGLMIGGSCFLRAFSMYLRMTGREVFQQSMETLSNNSHPVSWIRIRLLAERARKLGLKEEGTLLEKGWDKIAIMMKLREDYYGFYDKDFLPVIDQTLNDMLIETSPYQFKDNEIYSDDYTPKLPTPVHILNSAWYKFDEDPNNYSKWEKEAISDFVASARKKKTKM